MSKEDWINPGDDPAENDPPYEGIDWDFKPVPYDSKWFCPLCAHELDLNLEGGVTCPGCGWEGELTGNHLTPSDKTIDEMSGQWPDTLPWGEDEQDYYRKGGTDPQVYRVTVDHPPSWTLEEGRIAYIYLNGHVYWAFIHPEIMKYFMQEYGYDSYHEFSKWFDDSGRGSW
jgi:hypothetical protein